MARTFRYLYRTPWLLAHLLLGLPLVLLAMLPPWRNWQVGSRPLEHQLVRLWSAGLLRVFGLRVRALGSPLPGGVLLVANHVSWMDIQMIHSQHMVGFVAKAEIAGWPLVGWLAARGQTIFHQRGDTQSLGGVMDEMSARLRQQRPVAVFPEGRTRNGHEVGPFHARIFTCAVEAGVPVQPVAIRYGEQGRAQSVVAFGEREGFVPNFLRLLGEPARRAEVHFLEPIAPGQLEGRRQIAELARQRVVQAMAAA
ncbi:lysophospholipid acyltransferase family protein [Stenotrophomonas ginsengisoli]|nr:lysophospholipid acyltransferase family protein [Stenotrophomonas ginsengisoli]